MQNHNVTTLEIIEEMFYKLWNLYYTDMCAVLQK